MTTNDLPSFHETVRQALLLKESIFISIPGTPGGIWIALLVVLLAGLSEAFGQSIVLFINRVRPWRFGLALFISAFSHLFGYTFWTATIWLIGYYYFQEAQPVLALAAIVGLAYAPRLLSFFILTPYFGNMFSLLLSIWSLMATIVAIGVSLNLTLWQAAATSGFGWALLQIWYKTLGRPLYALGRRVENSVAGVPLKLTQKDIAGLRRPVPFIWEEWKERIENGSAQLSDNSLQHVSIPPRVANSQGEGS